LGSLIETAELLVSELVTNAVRASAKLDKDCAPGSPAPPVALRLSRLHTSLFIEVWDRDERPPVRRERAPRPKADAGHADGSQRRSGTSARSLAGTSKLCHRVPEGTKPPTRLCQQLAGIVRGRAWISSLESFRAGSPIGPRSWTAGGRCGGGSPGCGGFAPDGWVTAPVRTRLRRWALW
jgi:hypothetical protein